jgi:hypothetical protein
MVRGKQQPVRQHTWPGWLLLLFLPLAIGAVLLCLGLRSNLIGSMVRRQLVNCYVNVLGLVVFLLVVGAVFAVATLRGVNPIRSVSARPLRFLGFMLLLAFVGTFFLESFILSHAQLRSTLGQRMSLSAWNMRVGIGMGALYQLVWPVSEDHIDGLSRRGILLLGYALWGYVFASLFRMVPLLVGVE